MHVKVVEVVLVGWLILLSSESHKAFVIDIKTKRITAGDESVDPQVKLESFVEQGIVDISLHHALPIPLDLSIYPLKYIQPIVTGIFLGPGN